MNTHRFAALGFTAILLASAAHAATPPDPLTTIATFNGRNGANGRLSLHGRLAGVRGGVPHRSVIG